MSRVFRMFVLALLASAAALAGCQKESAQQADQRPPLAAPTSQNDADWRQYVGQMVSRNVKIKRGMPPFAVYISPDEDPTPTLDNVKETLSRGVLKDTIIAFGSRDSALMAAKMAEVFEVVPENSLKGVRVVFVGRAQDKAAAEAAVAGSGAEFIFLEVGS